jgi:hypothetical protein
MRRRGSTNWHYRILNALVSNTGHRFAPLPWLKFASWTLRRKTVMRGIHSDQSRPPVLKVREEREPVAIYARDLGSFRKQPEAGLVLTGLRASRAFVGLLPL